MRRIDKRFPNMSARKPSEADAAAVRHCRRWQRLCELYLPVKSEDSIWRLNRAGKTAEPSQGWKLHISATIVEACDLFERAAPFLISEDVQFKAPDSLDELSKLNCGLQYGYHQIGKFITVYPATENQAVMLARRLHKITEKFFAISIPFDEQYLPESSVFYRYGAFSKTEATDENGKTYLTVRNAEGSFVPDDRRKAVPEWISNPFPNGGKLCKKSFADTPLGTNYRIFRAIIQRGKGGIYQAVDFNRNEPRLCIIKEGRQKGDLNWNGQDGYFLVKNEFEVLKKLKKKYAAVPQVFDSFEVYGNFYFVMEYIEGKSLNQIMEPRKRRFSVKQIVKLAAEIAKIIEKIHRAGWVWNDCKPANLIVTKSKLLRPIDFENSYRANQSEPFSWKTCGFSKPADSCGKSADLYALGAVIYFLLTGKIFDSEKPAAIKKLRRNVPPKLIEITEKLLFDCEPDICKAGKALEKIRQDLN